MGMAASQARLLSITARLTDNEQSGQAISFAKERLADRTEQATTRYNNALAATKLQVMTGYADGNANYTDVSFAILSSPQVLNLGKQYIVTDTKGKVLVNDNVARAYLNANGSFNMFMGALGFSVSDIDPTVKVNDTTSTAAQKEQIEEEIHQAWDRYFVSIDKSRKYFVSDDDQTSHHWTFDYKENSDAIGDGFAIMDIEQTGFYSTVYQTDNDGNFVLDSDGERIPDYYVVVDSNGNPIIDYQNQETRMTTAQYNSLTTEQKAVFFTIPHNIQTIDDLALNYEGSTQEQLALFNRAVALTESYYSEGRTLTDSEGRILTDSDGNPISFQAHDFSGLKTNYNKEYSAEIKYYKNLFDKMLTSGFYSYTNTIADANDDPQHWIYQNEKLASGAATCTTDGSPLQDANTFEEYLKSGKLLLQHFSTVKNNFVSVSLSEDTCFQEVEDKTEIAAAEAKYNEDLQQIERLDTKYDMQLKRLDTEHNTLQTEYESVKKVLQRNVEGSFKTFS